RQVRVRARRLERVPGAALAGQETLRQFLDLFLGPDHRDRALVPVVAGTVGPAAGIHGRSEQDMAGIEGSRLQRTQQRHGGPGVAALWATMAVHEFDSSAAMSGMPSVLSARSPPVSVKASSCSAATAPSTLTPTIQPAPRVGSKPGCVLYQKPRR